MNMGIVTKKQKNSNFTDWQTQVLNQYYEYLPNRLKVSKNIKETGLIDWFKSQKTMGQFAHVQHNDNSFRFTMIVIDLDKPNAIKEYRKTSLPEPNIWVENPENGHAQGVFMLDNPVASHANARFKPILYFRRVKQLVELATGSDPQFKSFISKNALCEHSHKIHVMRSKLFSLLELHNAFLERGLEVERVETKKTFKTSVTAANDGFGRNCYIFEELAIFARRQRFKKEWLYSDFFELLATYAQSINKDFPQNIEKQAPLKGKELLGIVKSVCDWTMFNYQPNKQSLTPEEQEKFKGLQRFRNKKSQQVRKAAKANKAQYVIDFYAEGHKQKDIPNLMMEQHGLKVSFRSVKRYIQECRNF